MRKYLSILILITFSGCGTPSKIYYFGTEGIKENKSTILSLPNLGIIITHIDNKPTNIEEFKPERAYGQYLPPPTVKTLMSLLPGNHSLKYSYTYVIYYNLPPPTLPNNVKIQSSFSVFSRIANKRGELNITLKEGKKYSLIIDDKTSELLGKFYRWDSNLEFLYNDKIMVLIK